MFCFLSASNKYVYVKITSIASVELMVQTKLSFWWDWNAVDSLLYEAYLHVCYIMIKNINSLNFHKAMHIRHYYISGFDFQ